MKYIERIKKLRELMKNNNIHGYIIPSNDEFQNEFVPDCNNRLQYMTGFTGSNGVLILTHNKIIFYTDGRYTIQAKKELKHFMNTNYEQDIIILDMYKKTSCEIINNAFKIKEILGYNPMLHTYKNIHYYKNIANKTGFLLKAIPKKILNIPFENDPFINVSDNINNKNNKDHINNTNAIIFLSDKDSGESVSSKINKVLKKNNEKNNNIDYIFLPLSECICWLLNIRGNDTPTAPIVLCYAFINIHDKSIMLFTDKNKHKNLNFIFNSNDTNTKIDKKKNIKIELYNINDICKIYKTLLSSNKIIQFDFNTTPIFFIDEATKLKRQNHIINSSDGIAALKAIKNKTELKNIKLAHIADARAWGKFLFWINNVIKLDPKYDSKNDNIKSKSKSKSDNNIAILDEIILQNKLLKFQQQEKSFYSQSFPTISSIGENAAIIHYHTSKESNKKVDINKIKDNIKNNAKDKTKDNKKCVLYLCDAGVQYKYGTTDISRTIAIGEPSHEHKTIFTAVLKGHIDLANAKFLKGTTGSHLEILARKYLWELGLNYNHSTGHGVGYFLCVHEGPHGISFGNHIPLEENMIVSIEPGYYKEKEYGIRIENLYYIKKYQNLEKEDCDYLEFYPLTLVPIDTSLILQDELSKQQKEWLNMYNKLIDTLVNPKMDASKKLK